MSEIFGISFDVLSCPTLKISNPKENNPTNNSGWGIAWYPNDDYAASIVKDITNASAKNFSRMLSSWDNFNSTVFLFKLTGQNQVYTQHNTQPFNKSYGGRDWVFCHRGTINKDEFNKTLTMHEGVFEPLGTTDSEMLFCHLLSKFHDIKAKSISDVSPDILHLWLKTINQFGQADIALSDGQSIALYKDLNSTQNIYFKRYLPPQAGGLFDSQSIKLSIDVKSEANRTGLVFSSAQPINANEWNTLANGQLIIVRRGNVVWDSLKQQKEPEDLMPKQAESPTISQAPVQTQTSRQMTNVSETQQSHAIQKDIKNLFTLNVKATLTSNEGVLLQYKHFVILHETKYEYDKPVDRSTHLLRLQPIDDQIQELEQSTLELSTNCEKVQYEDVFGNHAIHLNIDRPYRELVIRSTSTVKIYQTVPDDFSKTIRRRTMPLVWMPWQRQMMSPYLLPQELPETQLQELSDYAMSFVERNDYNLFDTLEDINKSLHKDFQYLSGSTTLETTPYDVFASRQGVCQDFANLFICLARLLSIPARYRVGYIFTGGEYANKEQGDATHAWAEAYLPFIGWRGYDPTNGCLVAQDHIRVACGRHYRDATPTSGTVYAKNSIEKLSVNVTVEEIKS